MIAGPTVFTVTNGNGTCARWISSNMMNCSIAERPCPPNSTGQPMPEPAVGPSRRTIRRNIGLTVAHVADLRPNLGWKQLGEVGPQLAPHRQLFICLGEVHNASLTSF